MINEIPFPIPFSVTNSPNQTKIIVPAVIESSIAKVLRVCPPPNPIPVKAPCPRARSSRTPRCSSSRSQGRPVFHERLPAPASARRPRRSWSPASSLPHRQSQAQPSNSQGATEFSCGANPTTSSEIQITAARSQTRRELCWSLDFAGFRWNSLDLI